MLLNSILIELPCCMVSCCCAKVRRRASTPWLLGLRRETTVAVGGKYMGGHAVEGPTMAMVGGGSEAVAKEGYWAVTKG